MAWKPKEKQLTPEEAVEHAKRDLAPFWLGTSPLLAGVRGSDGKATAHPLDTSFDKKAWLLLFADLTEFSGEAVIQYAREWVRRYVNPDLALLLAVRPAYSFQTSGESLKSSFKKTPETYPVVLDHEGLITQAFAGPKQSLPFIKLLHQRKILFERTGPDWIRGAENEIQGYLRLKDPGLPLAPAFELANVVPADSARAEFGAKVRSPIFRLSGKISQEADRIVVQSSDATVQFSSPYPRVSIVAHSALTKNEVTRMRVELNGDKAFEEVTGGDLTFGDDGGSEIKVSDGRLYHMLRALPAKTRTIVLRFPDADRLPVALHGVRFSES